MCCGRCNQTVSVQVAYRRVKDKEKEFQMCYTVVNWINSNYFPTITENVRIPTKLPSATISIGPNIFTPLCIYALHAFEKWQKVFSCQNNSGYAKRGTFLVIVNCEICKRALEWQREQRAFSYNHWMESANGSFHTDESFLSCGISMLLYWYNKIGHFCTFKLWTIMLPT